MRPGGRPHACAVWLSLPNPLSSRNTLPAELAARSVKVATKLGGFITRVLADLASGSLEANVPLRAEQLRAVLSSLGPSFVKTGQALSGESLGWDMGRCCWSLVLLCRACGGFPGHAP